MDIGELTGLFAVVFGGSIILVPILALSARFALKPLIEAVVKARERPDAALQDRRIALLEAELDQVNTQLRQLQEGEEFRRQLASSAQTAAG
jgi:hypothetical protein